VSNVIKQRLGVPALIVLSAHCLYVISGSLSPSLFDIKAQFVRVRVIHDFFNGLRGVLRIYDGDPMKILPITEPLPRSPYRYADAGR
jgi:hypothetical protein